MNALHAKMIINQHSMANVRFNVEMVWFIVLNNVTLVYNKDLKRKY